MPLRSPRFYLFAVRSLLRASPTPFPFVDYDQVRVSHVHAQPLSARNTILLRVSVDVQTAVSSINVAGFSTFERLADTKVSRSLTNAAYRNVLPELHAVSFLPACQAHFNPNGKFGCKDSSSSRFIFNARLVAHRIPRITAITFC